MKEDLKTHTRPARLVLFDPRGQLLLHPTFGRGGAEWDREIIVARTEDEISALEPDMPGCIWAIDEVDLIMSPWYCVPKVKFLLDYGRHVGATVIANARQPHAVHRKMTGLSDILYCYHLSEDGDKKWVKACAGKDALSLVESFDGPDEDGNGGHDFVRVRL